jgi:restriction system protein
MPIPDYQTLMLPLLKSISDGQEHLMTDVIMELSNQLALSDEERRQMLPSGVQTVIYNRVGWARTYLLKAGLLDRPLRGKVRITQRGKDVLRKNPARIDVNFLRQFPEFLEFKKELFEVKATTKDEDKEESEIWNVLTPEEVMENGYDDLRTALGEELLDHVKSCSPTFFESLVIDLLVALGYGGSPEDARRVGKSGDGGIDGVIKEDKLGLETIYVQAKRWEGTVGRPAVQAFVGSLEGQKARKGVFITSSQFSNDAREYVKHLEKKVVLIDGQELAALMIEHGIGVTRVARYDVKRLDSDYFSEE